MPANHWTRRTFLSVVAAGTAGVAIAASHAAERTVTPIRLGVIGIGRRCRSHLATIRKFPDRCRVTAVCDRVEERAKSAAGRLEGSRSFTSHRELLAADLCDAVVITTPNYTHKEIAVDALGSGRHVLSEKPMATTLEDADAIVRTVEQAGRVFAVGLQFRHAPVYLKAKELLTSGAIGDLKFVWAEEFRGDWAKLYDDPEENAKKNWRYFQKLSGGMLVEKNCHDFDILGWLIDARPVRVMATGGRAVHTDRDTLDYASVLVEYANQSRLTLGVSLFAPAGKDNTTLLGTRGTIEFPRGGATLTVRARGRKDQRIDLHDVETTGLDDRGLSDLYKGFLDAIAGGPPPRTDVHVGRAALVVALAAEQSIEQHKPIDV